MCQILFCVLCTYQLLNNPARYHHYLHFTDKEMEVERVRNLPKVRQLVNSSTGLCHQSLWDVLPVSTLVTESTFTEKAGSNSSGLSVFQASLPTCSLLAEAILSFFVCVISRFWSEFTYLLSGLNYVDLRPFIFFLQTFYLRKGGIPSSS